MAAHSPDLNAAEAHGMAAGLLCVNPQTTSAYWLEELLDEGQSLQAEASQLLVRLFEETRRLLASESFEFDLLLPDDDELLSGRLLALKSWCQGFLFGIGCGQIRKALGGDAQSILKDVAEFTRLDTNAEGEEDEAAFAEITEYLRSAVMLLRDELEDERDTTIH
ncbi:MAG: UPF0149 family protein [Methylovulum sp.]|uniref:UPF0149 family protein n=1 Tax=Methylovulum sp. TaxID=1916980 RepID=UPI00260A6119|nr:UPF0149 family protein [Methylovulum sp.]MDD2724615.1 UPF0149 family protein [Methylovulum sp.]MDD5123358.1 UPF0149 family protein [Methylovulum sp.]